jgi:hypothetical protein
VLIDNDDEPYRFRGIYLGPRGYTFGFQWEYAAWWIAAGSFAAYLTVLVLIGIFPLLVSPVWAASLSVLTVKLTTPLLDPDRPIKSWRAAVRAELDTPRRPRPRVTPRRERPTIRYRLVEPPKP